MKSVPLGRSGANPL